MVLVKTEHKAEAKYRFSEINITTGGRKHLGSFIGNHEKTMGFIGLKVIECIQDVHELSSIALKGPQVAYSVYINGISCHWQF